MLTSFQQVCRSSQHQATRHRQKGPVQTSVIYYTKESSRSIQLKEAWHICYRRIHQEWDLHLACLDSACASTHRTHHTRPYAHHHQLASHICSLQPNPQNPLQSSKSVSFSSCNWSSDSRNEKKKYWYKNSFCVSEQAHRAPQLPFATGALSRDLCRPRFIATRPCLQY